MDVPVSELRSQLSDWLARVRGGTEVVITDRGVPVARLLGMSESTTALERLAEQGIIARPLQPRRPVPTAHLRPRPTAPLSDRIGEQRR
ncbi:MAG: type II toxin-antitoxin system Phd/YefM family antitoxin [Acidimicrobiales bacterium]